MRRPKHSQSRPEDHDSPWKGALVVFFKPFMDFLYPHISELIVQNRRQSVCSGLVVRQRKVLRTV